MSRITATAVVEDPALRSAVQSLVSEMPDTELLGIGADLTEVTSHLDDPELDVVLVHTGLTRADFRAVIRELQTRRPFVAVLVLAPDPDTGLLQSVMELGARGVLAQPLSLDEVRMRLEAAATWSRGLRHYSGGEAREERGRVIALAGAKGGVGTTSLGVLLVQECAAAGRTACIVDGVLRGGMVHYFSDVKPRRNFADLADVANELTGRNVREVVVDSAAGYSVLGAPTDVERADEVTGTAARQVLHQLRYLYDVIIVDVGHLLEDAQAAMLEMADDVVMVVGADIASINAARATLSSWERLSIRPSAQVEFIFNGVDRRREVQPDMATRILGKEPICAVPSDFAQLEAAHNVGNLPLVKEGSLRHAVRLSGTTLGLLPRSSGQRRSRNGRSRREAGQAAIELPFAVALFLVAFIVGIQLLFAASAVAFARHGATAGARELSVTGDTGLAGQAARDAVPSIFEGGFGFTSSGDSVKVAVNVPTVVPVGRLDMRVSQTAAVQREPGR
jgi:pilus assembly protein CpaE